MSSVSSSELKMANVCNMIPDGVTLYAPCHETKHKICSREINLTTGEIKRHWNTGRQPAVSHSFSLFFSPAASCWSTALRKDQAGRVWHSDTLSCVFPSNHAEPDRQRRARGLWPLRARKREMFTMNFHWTLCSPADIARPCITCVWAINC